MRRFLGIYLFGFALFLCGLGTGRWLFPDVPEACSADLIETWDKVKTLHVDGEPSSTKLKQGTLAGLVASLDDPHSAYIEPMTAKFISENDSGTFFGIGASVTMKHGLPVVSPLRGSQAEKAGLRKDDFILEVDGKKTQGSPLLETISRIRGKDGTVVTLLVQHEGEEKPREVKVTRSRVVTESVKVETVAVGDKAIAHITVTEFHSDTERLFEKAVGDAIGQGADGVILDLRDNPGGFLNAAVTMACRWKSGVPQVRLVYRDKPADEITCGRGALLEDMPTVVLVNGNSASASEVVTGALQDYGKAYVIGEKTYGKGSGQQSFKYADGAQLRLTTFLWKTPKDRSIHKTGLMPDEVLAADPKDLEAGKDVQLDRAVQYLSTGR